MWLDYTGIRVTDLPRSLLFYVDVLGLSELSRGKMDHGGVWVLLHDRRSRQYLELNWYPAGSKFYVPYTAGEALDHIGFGVPDVADGVAYLLRNGARPAPIAPSPDADDAAYVLDPDGTWIELCSGLSGPFHLHYTGIRVKELDRSVEFYTRTLGLKEALRGDLSRKGGGTFVGLSDPNSGQRLELNWYPKGSPFAVPFSAGEGLDHIGVRTDDALRTSRELEAAGGRSVDERRREDGRLEVAYVTDPSGVWIELIDDPFGFPKGGPPPGRPGRRAPASPG